MYRYLLIMLFLFSFISSEAQDFIGFSEDKIRKAMSTENPGFVIDEEVKNDVFRYLKYYSDDERETWVIFLDDFGRCNGVRLTCDNNLIGQKVNELNSLYKQRGNNSWSNKKRGEEISIDIKNETWFFTITYRRTNKKASGGDNRAA